MTLVTTPAKPRRGAGRKFQKGNKFGRGSAKIIVGIPGRKITASDVSKALSAHLFTPGEDGETMFNKMILATAQKAVKEGDYRRIDFFLNRIIGKVPDNLTLDQKTKLLTEDRTMTIEKLQGGELILKVQDETVGEDEGR